MSRSFVRWALLLGLAPSSAWGQEGAAEANYVAPVERRSGLSVGIQYGFGMGSYVGYPNEVGKMSNPEYRSATGTSLASGYSIWLGGALRDWLVFGAGMFTSGGGSDEVSGGAAAFGLHLEVFPLFPLGGVWRDLGLATEFGAGGGLTEDSDNNETGNGGNMSMVGLGAFFEPWQFWHMSHGPVLTSRYQFSDSMTAFSIVAGWRMAFYWTQKD